MRTSPVLSDTKERPSLLRTTPAKKPRTECCCQPVAFMMAAMVAPCWRWSISITRACFESRADGFADCFGASSLLVSVSFIGILHSVVTASRTVTTEAPQVAIKPAGQDPESADRALQARTVTLCWRHKSSPFWIILLLVSGRAQHQMTHPTPKCMDGPISPMIRRVVSKSPTRKAPPAPPALQLSLFDERDLAEIESPEFPGERLVVCKNPALQDLKDIQARIVRKRQPLRGADKIGLAVGALLGRRKVAKHFRLAITDAALSFTRDHAAIATEAALDGFYVLRTNVPADALNAAGTVRAYKSLARVERA